MASPSDQASFAAMLAESDMRVPQEQQPDLLEGYQHMLTSARSAREAFDARC
jgi:hypothetical protein